MKSTIFTLAGFFSIIAAQGQVFAQQIYPRAPNIPLACSETSFSPAEERLLDATAYLVPKTFVTTNPDTTYNIQTSFLVGLGGLDANDDPIVLPIDPDSQFYGGPSIGSSAYIGRGRTAVLIGSNLFLSAAHSAEFDPANFYAVFLPREFGCSLSALSSVPRDLVYDPAGSATLPINTVGSGRQADYSAFRVDRVVTGRKPVKMRRSGEPRREDPLVLIGHPLWSGARIERSGRLTGYVGSGSFSGQYRYEALHPFVGSSGSAVYNLKDEVIDSVISSNINGFLAFHLDAYGNNTLYDASNFAHEFQSYGNTNANAITVSDLIPRLEVLVTPISDIRHVVDIGASVTHPISTYEILGGFGSNQYEVIPPASQGPNTPTLNSNIPPGDRVAGFFNPHVLELTADISNVTTCGIWDYAYNVRDRYNEQNNYLRHRFEVGVEEISLLPLSGTEIFDLGPPFTQSHSYTVKNTRPTATNLVVRVLNMNGTPTSAGHWLLVNGATTYPVTLQAAGTPGDTATLALSINPMHLSSQLAPLSSQIRVDFENLACTVQAFEDLTRIVTFTEGTQFFSDEASGNDLPTPTKSTYGTPEIFAFDLSAEQGLCLTDLDVSVDFFDSAFNGFYTSPPEATPLLKIAVRAPSGAQHTFWEGQATPNPSYVTSRNIFAFGSELPSKNFKLDDESTPPLSMPLSTFDGEALGGIWKLEVSRSGTSSSIAPLRAEMKFSASSSCP